MQTFFINTSPQQTDLSRVTDLMTGLEDRLTVLNADGPEALGPCVRDQAFSPVQQAFGTDRRLNIILFREFTPGENVPRNIRSLMLDILMQETQFIQQSADILRDICEHGQARLETVTFLLGERCGHGTSKSEARSTIANHEPQKLTLADDPARMQAYFNVRYAYIDMDTHPRNREVRSDWYFYFQIITFACLEAQGLLFPLEYEDQEHVLDGSSFTAAFPLPAFSPEKASGMFSRKIRLLERQTGLITSGKYETKQNAGESRKDPPAASGPEMAGAPAYFPRLFSTWTKNRDRATGALEKMIAANRENLEKARLCREKMTREGVSEPLRYRIDQEYQKLTERSGILEKLLTNEKQRLEQLIQPLRTPRSVLTCIGILAALYLLLTPFGLTPPPAPFAVLAAFILIGAAVFSLAANTRLFPEMKKARDNFQIVWGPAEQCVREWTALRADEQKARDDDGSPDQDLLKSQVRWHRDRLTRLSDTLRHIALNTGLDPDQTALAEESQPSLDPGSGLMGNARVYGFSMDEFKELYVPGGEGK